MPRPPAAMISTALWVRPATMSERPVRVNFAAISVCDELDAMRQGKPSAAVASSAARAPGMGSNSAARAAVRRVTRRSIQSGPSGRSRRASTIGSMS